jgi:outer membrane murein-binding lipoprotein Lpp
MKNVKFLMGVLAMGALVVAGCSKKDNKQDMDNIAEDGFYVVGAATAVESVNADNAAKGLMGAGINEVDKTARAGLYEKYIALEGGKEFELVLKEGTAETHYGANLEEGDPYDVAYGVTIKVLKGVLAQNLKMKVPTSGFYHIALDLNKAGDLPNASVIVAPVEWEINASADMKMVASDFNKEKMTWTLKDVEMKKGAKYKYAYGNGWKIKVTPAAEVNIETNLGEGMVSGATDIVIAKSGKYTFELVWNLAGGKVEKSFTDNTKCTEEIEDKLPDNLYMIGNYCGWDWAKATTMTRLTEKDAFWTVKYILKDEGSEGRGFKFSTTTAWDGNDFTGLLNGVEGATVPGNVAVDADGLYLIVVDYAAEKVLVSPAKIYGMGDAFGGWTGVEMTVNGDKVEGTTTAAGNLRMFAYGDALKDAMNDNWWRSEFLIDGGKIVYRGNKSDFDKWETPLVVPVTAGQKITLDFNAGTGTIQ